MARPKKTQSKRIELQKAKEEIVEEVITATEEETTVSGVDTNESPVEEATKGESLRGKITKGITLEDVEERLKATEENLVEIKDQINAISHMVFISLWHQSQQRKDNVLVRKVDEMTQQSYGGYNGILESVQKNVPKLQELLRG